MQKSAAPSLDLMVDELAGLSSAASDFDKITQLEMLQTLINAAAGAIARVSVDLDDSQREEQRRLRVPSKERGRGVADQIALARRISPHLASRDLGMARALRDDLPKTGRLLSAGQISERTAQAVHRESDHLDAGPRRRLDAELAPHLPDASVRGASNSTRRIALALDPDGATKRARKAEGDRAVWFKPAQDGMCKIVAYLPAAQGLSVFNTLKRDTATQIVTGAVGDERTRPQVMADLFTERVTGRSIAEGPPVEVQLVMPAAQVFGMQPVAADGAAHPVFGIDASDPDGPAWLAGYGPIPAAIARGVIAGVPDLLPAPDVLDQAQAWLRRVFTDPRTGEVVDIDTRRRSFDGALRRFITIRDQVCRAPGCDAPIRDIDHMQRHGDGGRTNAENGVGLCQRFNLVKEVPGWRTEIVHGIGSSPPGSGPPAPHRHTLRITTPTGKVYYSSAPASPGAEPAQVRTAESTIERALALDLAWAA